MKRLKIILRFRGTEMTMTEGYGLLSSKGSPWHLTMPLSPMRQGPAEGLTRPHLTRHLGGKRVHRRVFDRDTYALGPVTKAPGEAGFERAASITFGEVCRWVEERDARMNAVREARAFRWTWTDADLRSRVLAVDSGDFSALQAAVMAKFGVPTNGTLVMDLDVLFRMTADRALFEDRWKGPEEFDAVVAAADGRGVAVRVRFDCGTVEELRTTRDADGSWGFCRPGELTPAERTQIFEADLPPLLREGLYAAAKQVGLPFEQRAFCPSCGHVHNADPPAKDLDVVPQELPPKGSARRKRRR